MDTEFLVLAFPQTFSDGRICFHVLCCACMQSSYASYIGYTLIATEDLVYIIGPLVQFSH